MATRLRRQSISLWIYVKQAIILTTILQPRFSRSLPHPTRPSIRLRWFILQHLFLSPPNPICERCFSRRLCFNLANCLAESSTILTAKRTCSILVPSLISRDSSPLIRDPLAEPTCSCEQTCCFPLAVATPPCAISTNLLPDPTAPNRGSDGVVIVASLNNPSFPDPITSSLLCSRILRPWPRICPEGSAAIEGLVRWATECLAWSSSPRSLSFACWRL